VGSQFHTIIGKELHLQENIYISQLSVDVHFVGSVSAGLIARVNMQMRVLHKKVSCSGIYNVHERIKTNFSER
jgi:hypothetical protein